MLEWTNDVEGGELVEYGYCCWCKKKFFLDWKYDPFNSDRLVCPKCELKYDEWEQDY